MAQYRRTRGADGTKDCPEKANGYRESKHLAPLAEMRPALNPSDEFFDGASPHHHERNLANKDAGKYASPDSASKGICALRRLPPPPTDERSQYQGVAQQECHCGAWNAIFPCKGDRHDCR